MLTKLPEKALLVDIRIGNWSARIHDADASQSVSNEYKNDPAYARVNKSLVAREEIQKIWQLVYEARRYHYSVTLPWGDNGSRLLPATLYLDFTKKISAYRQQFISRVEKFLSLYPDLIKDAKKSLGGLFKQDDYPSPGALRGKFSFETHFTPISDANDVRVKLQEEDVEKLKRQIEARQTDLQAEAMRSVWERLYEVVGHLSEKLNDPKAIIRDSVVEKVHDLVAILPKLNIAGDAALNSMTNEIRKKIIRHTPEEMRKTDGVRGEVAKEASEILDKMKGYVGGGGGK
jgi:hypothetical protein